MLMRQKSHLLSGRNVRVHFDFKDFKSDGSCRGNIESIIPWFLHT